jgi:hypothetical protein
MLESGGGLDGEIKLNYTDRVKIFDVTTFKIPYMWRHIGDRTNLHNLNSSNNLD